MTTVHPSLSYPAFGNQSGADGVDMMDSWVDFNAIPSPGPSTRPAPNVNASQSDYNITSPASTTVPFAEEEFEPAKPSHDYSQFKQQTGIPNGTLRPSNGPSHAFGFDGFSNSGLALDFLDTEGLNSGLGGMDVDLATPAYFFAGDNSQHDSFVNPSSISAQEEQQQANVRLFPGAHKQKAQQAALAKAQEERARQMHRQQILKAAQQQQQQSQQQQQQQQQESQTARAHPTAAKRASLGQSDARVEEIIGRVVNQIRQNSHMNGDMTSPPPMSHAGRMRKDEEDMDEDERLLASEEGKKLSSKERRQLRNKVSARAFRSRRKEYISQLESEVAQKATECQELHIQNHALAEENARSRAFIEKLLRHPAFNPFLDDLSRDPSIMESLPKLAPPAPVPSQTLPSSSSQDFNDFKTPVSATPSQNLHVGMTMIPETPMDISMLNLGGGNWNNIDIPGFNGFQHNPQIFALTELPQAPVIPDFSAMSGKGSDSFVSRFMEEKNSEAKADYPAIESRKETEPAQVATVSFDAPADFELYANAPVSTPASSTPLFPNIVLPTKNNVHHFELVTKSAATQQELMSSLEAMCERLDSSVERMRSLSGL